MAILHGKGSKIFLAEYDFSGSGRSADLSWTKAATRSDGYSDNWHEHIEGSIDSEVAVKAMFSNVAGSLDYFIHNTLGSFPGSPAVSGVAYNGEVKATSMGVPVSIEDVVLVEPTFKVTGPLGRGKVAEYEVATTVSPQTGTGIDMGAAASTDEMWLVTYHILSCTGGTATIKLQESSDNGSVDTYEDVEGSSHDFTTAGSWCGTINGAREQYVRVVFAPGAGTPWAKFVVVVSKVNKQ